MAYRGVYDGRRVYDYLDDVPDPILESGQKFVLLHPPSELIDDDGVVMTKGSPFAITTLIFMGLMCLFVAITGYYLVQALQQWGYITWGRPAKAIGDDTLELGDGTIIQRNPETGKWEVVHGANVNPMVQMAIIGFLIIVAIIIVWVVFQRKQKEKAPKEKEHAEKEKESETEG